MAFVTNVFVNCPFDDKYLRLLRPLLFTVIYLGLKSRIALERDLLRRIAVEQDRRTDSGLEVLDPRSIPE
jgi:hypothetical protein